MPDTPLPDDDDDKWIYKKHTRAKHEILHYYLKVWTSIVSKEQYDLRVFDCFAGRGDYVDSDGAPPIPLENIQSEADYPGSPILTLDAVSEHCDKFKSAQCYFMEPTKRNREVLEETLSNTSHPDNVRPHVLNKRFPDDVNKVLRDTGGNRGFAFLFIDPYNIKYLDYDTVTRIVGTPRFDCLLTVMTSQLIQWGDSESHHEGYKRFFGRDDWRSDLENFVPEQLTTREAEYYCKRLEENGADYTLAYMTTDGDSRQLKYHLVFTTNDETGVQAMKESMMRCGGDYTLAYAPERAEISHEQQSLQGGYLSDEDRIKGWLLSRFAGETISFEEVCQRAMAEQRYEEALEKDYRGYFKNMHNDGTIEIPEREAPDGPLPARYQIEFPEEGSD